MMIVEGNGHMVETTVKGSPVVGCTNRGISDVDLLTDEIVSEQLTRYFRLILEDCFIMIDLMCFFFGIFWIFNNFYED